MNSFIHVLRHELSLSYRTYGISAIGVAGLLLLISMGRWVQSPQVPNIWSAFGPVMLVAGAVVTSSAFSELGTPGRRLEYLLRPAESWEKVLAKLVLTSIGYWMIMVFAFIVASALGIGLFLILNDGGSLRGSFAEGRWFVIALQTLRTYLTVHAVFFFGSVYFRKHAFGHTLLAVVAWITSYAIIGVVAIRLVFHPYFTGYRQLSDQGFFSFQTQIEELFTNRILANAELYQIIAEVILVLFFWTLSWARLRETEA